MATANQKILDAVHALETKLDVHIAENTFICKKTDEMYKLFVTGDGVPSYQERLRVAEAWISLEKWLIGSVTLLVLADIVIRFWRLAYPI